MKYQVFRNYTVENLFYGLNAVYAGYCDISFIDEEADRYIWMFFPPISLCEKSFVSEVDSYIEMLNVILNNIPSNKSIFVLSTPKIFDAEILLNNSITQQAFENYNRFLSIKSNECKNVIHIDTNLFFEKFSSTDWIDWRYFFISKMIINPPIAKEFNKWFKSMIAVYGGERKKCIVLDLDNTLWGGVLGEEGVTGIKIGGDYPGNVFEMFQKYLLELSRKGVMLAICSKNNEQDVLEAWNKNPYLILKQDDFVAWYINWNNKADNIKMLSEKLNIGLDSIVFIDDNPSERELIKQLLPLVEVPEFPQQSYNIPKLIHSISTYFYTFRLTNEDREKTIQYKSNFKREKLKNVAVSFEDYLKNLEIQLEIEEVNEFNLERIVQLTQKTNQFNLTTKRYTEQDILKFKDQGAKVFGLTVQDRFGSYGLVGVIVLIVDKILIIDTLLLSCRVLGKEIEFVFLNEILDYLKKSDFEQIEAEYIRTTKNIQTEFYYEKIGFKLISANRGTKKYRLHLKNFSKIANNNYKIVFK